VVICLEWGADLHMAQLMPLPLAVSCFSKIQIGFTFWYQLTRVVPDKGPLNACVWELVCSTGALSYNDHAHSVLSSKPAARRHCCRSTEQTDRRTPDHYTHPALHTMQTVSTNRTTLNTEYKRTTGQQLCRCNCAWQWHSDGWHERSQLVANKRE